MSHFLVSSLTLFLEPAVTVTNSAVVAEPTENRSCTEKWTDNFSHLYSCGLIEISAWPVGLELRTSAGSFLQYRNIQLLMRFLVLLACTSPVWARLWSAGPLTQPQPRSTWSCSPSVCSPLSTCVPVLSLPALWKLSKKQSSLISSAI